jgi:hypothetical protein
LGDVQLLSVGTDVGPLKSHTKWSIPVPLPSSPSKLNSIEWKSVVSPSLIAIPLLSGTKALIMVVSGAVVSTVKPQVAGDASGFPAASVANTENS